MEEEYSSETLVTSYQTALRRTGVTSNLNRSDKVYQTAQRH